MRRKEEEMRLGGCALVALAAILAGCGGTNEPAKLLRDGVYRYELSEQHLLDNGIGLQQAKDESGDHAITLDGGSFVDRWRSSGGRGGSCGGTYTAEGSTVTFRWTYGCFGDWTMRYTVDGATVTWADIDVLPPYDDEEEQKVAEVFNSVPWTRVGDPPS